MKTIAIKYPLDILLCLGYSIILLPVVLFNINGTFQILLGLPFILFIPGYLLLLCIFPNNTSELDPIYKFGISIGLSISVVPLIGILLYYSPFGLNLISILTSIFIIILLSGIIAIYHWQKLPQQKQLTISFNVPRLKSKSKFDQILMFFLLVTIIISIITAAFISFSPKKQELSTEFYILGITGKTTNYPENLKIGQNSNVTIGLINHEYKTINYTIEIWLVNQTISYNNHTNTNETVYHDMWFLNKVTVRLDHFIKNTDIIWQPQWKYLYNFSINKTGRYTLMFLLFTTPTLEYNKIQNYQKISALKIQSAYESNYFWLNIIK
jgi:uncharacterized membrane protein